jgi:hypothetical protein
MNSTFTSLVDRITVQNIAYYSYCWVKKQTKAQASGREEPWNMRAIESFKFQSPKNTSTTSYVLTVSIFVVCHVSR